MKDSTTVVRDELRSRDQLANINILNMHQDRTEPGRISRSGESRPSTSKWCKKSSTIWFYCLVSSLFCYFINPNGLLLLPRRVVSCSLACGTYPYRRQVFVTERALWTNVQALFLLSHVWHKIQKWFPREISSSGFSRKVLLLNWENHRDNSHSNAIVYTW